MALLSDRVWNALAMPLLTTIDNSVIARANKASESGLKENPEAVRL
jgi:hypothetical protein